MSHFTKYLLSIAVLSIILGNTAQAFAEVQKDLNFSLYKEAFEDDNHAFQLQNQIFTINENIKAIQDKINANNIKIEVLQNELDDDTYWQPVNCRVRFTSKKVPKFVVNEHKDKLNAILREIQTLKDENCKLFYQIQCSKQKIDSLTLEIQLWKQFSSEEFISIPMS